MSLGSGAVNTKVVQTITAKMQAYSVWQLPRQKLINLAI